MTQTVYIQICGFKRTKTIPLPIAPFTVTLGEGDLAGQVDVLTAPKGYDEIHPLLAAIGTVRAGDWFIRTRKHLVGERNEVVLQRYYAVDTQIVLP